ncbi:MAG: class I SAM-dependent methyltransferase [Gammaproteobacteria bacterium]|nr:class I SAM-dependent methyltransferase [Gammaproteobacteria bacterium]
MTKTAITNRVWDYLGMEPTLNGTGFMYRKLDPYAEAFIEQARLEGGLYLDMGCAYGIASIAALEAGGQVTACDPEAGHLKILLENTPEALRENLLCITDELPGLNLPDDRYDAILCSRVLHFLDGSAIDASVRKMHRWLKPGGRLYLVADTPYGIWRRLIPIFEARRERGDRWPGLMIGLENYLPVEPEARAVDGSPFMNLLDPELLTRICTEADFSIEQAGFIERTDFRGKARMDGRENAGICAIKPR